MEHFTEVLIHKHLNVGDTIKKGILFVLLAVALMKLVRSFGTIVKVLVDDATPIEFDQPLFLVDPS